MADWKSIYANLNDEEKADFDSKIQKIVNEQISSIKSKDSDTLNNKLSHFCVSESLTKSIGDCNIKTYGNGSVTQIPGDTLNNIKGYLQSAAEEFIKCIRNDLIVCLHNKEITNDTCMELTYTMYHNDDSNEDNCNIRLQLSTCDENCCYTQLGCIELPKTDNTNPQTKS